MDARNDLYRGGGEGYASQQSLKLKYANRHDLIAGATGTGKIVTLKIMAEEFSAVGGPVFLSDVKSDLAGDLMQREFVTARRYSGTPGTFAPCRGRRCGICTGSSTGQRAKLHHRPLHYSWSSWRVFQGTLNNQTNSIV